MAVELARHTLAAGEGGDPFTTQVTPPCPPPPTTTSGVSGLVPYEDVPDRFTIQVPDKWLAGTGSMEGASGYTGATGGVNA